MTISLSKPIKASRSFRPSTARAQSVEFSAEMMQVSLTDGRVIGVPLVWFPKLINATHEQRMKYEVGGEGLGLHWPDLDEDLLVSGLLAGGGQ